MEVDRVSPAFPGETLVDRVYDPERLGVPSATEAPVSVLLLAETALELYFGT